MVNALMVRGLTHRYPGRGTPALDDLGFDLPENWLAFVLGAKGSGKSTLFRILLRLTILVGALQTRCGKLNAMRLGRLAIRWTRHRVLLNRLVNTGKTLSANSPRP